MAFTYTAAEETQVRRMQLEIAKALQPFSHNTEAALAVFAMARNMRTLLRQYPPEVRDALVEAVKMYLDGTSPDTGLITLSTGAGGRGVIQ